jgi:hypothetical protein
MESKVKTVTVKSLQSQLRTVKRLCARKEKIILLQRQLQQTNDRYNDLVDFIEDRIISVDIGDTEYSKAPGEFYITTRVTAAR